MSLRKIEITASAKIYDKIQDLASQYEAIDIWHTAKNKDGRQTTSILVDIDNQQDMLDAFQRNIMKEDNVRITLLPVEATLPRIEGEDKTKNGKGRKLVGGGLTREELYSEIERGAKLDIDFIIMVVLSTIVASIGLLSDSEAVVIGAMVIAPLLGPNLAMSFGTALGDLDLIFRAMRTNFAGLGLTLLISLVIGLFLDQQVLRDSVELMARTDLGFAGIFLALASGAAAVLSMTTGMSSALVGVMVAVALMPPAVTLGMTLGNGQFFLAYGAMLLLGANIVCVNLSAQAVFVIRGIRPRTWYEEKKSKQSIKNSAIGWGSLLAIIVGLMLVRKLFLGE